MILLGFYVFLVVVFGVREFLDRWIYIADAALTATSAFLILFGVVF